MGAIVKKAVFLEADDKIDIDVRNKELGALAEIVQEVTKAEVLVPVGRFRDSITTSIEGTTFAEVLETLGLGLRSSQDSAG